MPNPIHRQLLNQARRLARWDPKRPQQANLRRAISAAYYALFHFLVDQACRCIFGTAHGRRVYRDLFARAFSHRAMKNACTTFAGGTLPKHLLSRLPSSFAVPRDVRGVARAFNDAQEKRHLADYDMSKPFTRADVLATIRDVEQAIVAFGQISGQIEAKFFLCCLLAWNDLVNRK